MSGDFPVIPPGGSSNAAIHPLYPFTSLQNVNPSTSITPSMSFGLVYGPSIPLVQREENIPMAIEQMGGGSGSYEHNEELRSNDVQETATGRTRRSSHQVQELEGVFKECSNPDQEQRLKISGDLGLTPLQVKFWFQNRRTQEKVKQERNEKAILKAQNEELKSERMRLHLALNGNIIGYNVSEVSSETDQLCLENAELRKGLDRLNDVISILAGCSKTEGRAASPIPFPALDSNTQMISPNPTMQLEDETLDKWLFGENGDESFLDETIDDWFSEFGLEAQYDNTGDGIGATWSTPVEAKKLGSDPVMPVDITHTHALQVDNKCWWEVPGNYPHVEEGNARDVIMISGANWKAGSKEGDDGHSPEAGGPLAGNESKERRQSHSDQGAGSRDD